MAIDIKYYPRVKKVFNPPGKRGFLYIGINDPVKGTDFLSKIFEILTNYRRGWIGYGGEIKNIPRISYFRRLTPDFMKTIAEKYDFFITTGIADANPTTILESMAWGFPVICTPQSGYHDSSYIKNIYYNDINKTIEILQYFQYVDEKELRHIADEARKVVKTRYTWRNFTEKVMNKIWELLKLKYL